MEVAERMELQLVLDLKLEVDESVPLDSGVLGRRS